MVELVGDSVIRHPLVAAIEEQSKAVRHILGSEDFVISFKGPAGTGKTPSVESAQSVPGTV